NVAGSFRWIELSKTVPSVACPRSAPSSCRWPPERDRCPLRRDDQAGRGPLASILALERAHEHRMSVATHLVLDVAQDLRPGEARNVDRDVIAVVRANHRGRPANTRSWFTPTWTRATAPPPFGVTRAHPCHAASGSPRGVATWRESRRRCAT